MKMQNFLVWPMHIIPNHYEVHALNLCILWVLCVFGWVHRPFMRILTLFGALEAARLYSIADIACWRSQGYCCSNILTRTMLRPWAHRISSCCYCTHSNFVVYIILLFLSLHCYFIILLQFVYALRYICASFPFRFTMIPFVFHWLLVPSCMLCAVFLNILGIFGLRHKISTDCCYYSYCWCKCNVCGFYFQSVS